MTPLEQPSLTGPPAHGRGWSRGWGPVTLLVLNLVTATVAVAVLGIVIGGIATLPGLLLGLLLLIPGLWAAENLGHLERLRIRAFTGVTIPPRSVEPATTWRRLVLSPVRWRSAGFLALHALWGVLSGAVVTVLLAQSLLVLVLPLINWLFPGARLFDAGVRVWWLVSGDSFVGLTTLWLLAALVLLLLPPLAQVLSRVDIHLASWLLGPDPERQIQQLTDRVDALTVTRDETVDSVEAERRRIERDLHDGPQQRLVSIAMDLGMAREALARDPSAAQELLEQAHAASKDAIVEMRQVARGITPPILTDRGLDAALSALAARSPVPVSVRVGAVGRLDPTIEAIAYFVVSEALTNVAKHAAATGAQVDVDLVTQPRPSLAVQVRDNGVGGAVPEGGTGLTGLRQRVAAVDGTLGIDSPTGGPTTIRAELPLRMPRSTS